MRSVESVSALLFVTARQVVADQGLLESGPELTERREAFLAELRGVLGDMDRMHQIALQQFIDRDTAARRSGQRGS